MVTAVSARMIRLFGCGVLVASLLTGCGGSSGYGGGGGGGGGSTTYSIGGSVTGLTGSVVLQNNGGSNLTVSANGAFSFTSSATSGTAYNITVLTQPVGRTCVVTNGTGTVATANISATVACTANQYTLGGQVSGLSGTLVLAETSGEDSVAVSAAGNFMFGAKLTHGATYGVTVYKQPAGQTCTVNPATATGTATANVSTVAINCVNNQFTVSATVTGLTSGTMVLQLNLGDDITVGNGTTAFPKPLAAGDNYLVSVIPSTQTTHSCVIGNAAGLVAANVSVTVNCTPLAATGTVGGTVSGLAASTTVVLRNSLTGETVSRGANGGFTFTTPVTMGAEYFVSVDTQPSGQICTVANASGNVAPISVNLVGVVCAAGTETHTVGGAVTGLKAPLKLAMSVNNAFLDVNPSGSNPVSFTFPVPVQFGGEFQVVPRIQPTGQTCLIPHSGSQMGHSNLTDIQVVCVDNTTDLLTGTYTSYGGDFVLTLYGGGIYVFASVDDDASCGASRGSGVEMGAYNYNAATGAVSFISNVLDTNGATCGVWRNGASIINGAVLVKTGKGQSTVLNLTLTPGTAPQPLVPVPSIGNQPVGPFFLAGSWSFLVLGNDGHYLEVNANNDPATNAPAGVEYGCYARTGVNIGTITPTISAGSCTGAVDTDNTAGLSDLAGTAINFSTGPSFLILNSQTVLLRVLAN